MSTSTNGIKAEKGRKDEDGKEEEDAVSHSYLWSERNSTVFFPIKCKNIKHKFFQQQLKKAPLFIMYLKCHMGYDVSHHLGAPWYWNHITVVPLLPSVVYIETVNKEVYVIWCFGFSETQLSRHSLWGSVSGSVAAAQVWVLPEPEWQGALTHSRNISINHLSFHSFPSHCCVLENRRLALFCLILLRRKHSLKYSLQK